MVQSGPDLSLKSVPPNSGSGGDQPPQLLRLFVAIQLPEPVRGALRETQTQLKSVLSPRSVAWTRPENLHLTLRFLGNVDAVRLPDLRKSLRDAVAANAPFEAVCGQLGCFPNLRFPRVIWAGVQDADDRLRKLHHAINHTVGRVAERPAEKRFTGHVTLGRPKTIQPSDAQQLARFVAAASGRLFGEWRVTEVELIQSRLSPEGSRYTTLDAFPLSGYESGRSV